MKKNILLFSFLSLLILSSTAVASDFSIHGYYRNRIVSGHDFDLQSPNGSIPNSNDRFGYISYNQMRLRLEPHFKLNDHVALHSIFDVLDNVTFGSSNTKELNVLAPAIGTLTFPPGAGSFYVTGGTAGQNGSINVRAVWADILSPIGLFRIGRQPSHWGLGIFQNDGRDRQSDFGDMQDRIAWLVQYDLAGPGSISTGLAWDIPFEAQFDPRTDGLDGQVKSNSEDANQWGAFVLYEQDNMQLGVLGGYRRRSGNSGATTMTVTDAAGNSVASGIDGNTNLYFGDLYGKYEHGNYYVKAEGIYVGGKVTTGLAIDGIAFEGIGAAAAGNTCGSGGIICLPAGQNIQVLMAALEAGAEYKFGGEWNVKTGFAQGDQRVLSSKITQLGFRPDYQIANLMFNIPLGTSPTLYDASSGANLVGGKPITGNYINNALYFSAGYKQKFTLPKKRWWKIGGQVTTAWAHKKNVNVDFAALTGTANLPVISEKSSNMWRRWYGVEADISLEAKFLENLYTVLDLGVLLPGKAYDIEVNLTDPGAIVSAIPADKANIAWMAKLTTMLEF